MCGRFTVTTKDTKTDRRPLPGRAGEGAGAELGGGNAPAPTAKERAEEGGSAALGRFNVAPTQEILVVRSSPDPEEAAQGEREARLMRWGLVPRWAKDLKVGYRMINAKAENLDLEPRLRAAGRQVPPPLPDRRRRLLRVDEGRGPEAAAPALALHRRRRRAVRLRRPLHPQGVGGPRGPRLRRRLALQRTIVTTTPNEVVARSTTGCRRSCPNAEAEAAWLRPATSSRGRDRDVRAARRRARMDGAPANPKLNKVGKGMRGRAGAAGRAADRLRPRASALLRASSSSRSSCFSSSASSLIGGEIFSEPAVSTVALPALVVSVQAIFARRDAGRFPDRVEGQFEVLLRLARAAGSIRGARCRPRNSGHSSLTPFSVVKRCRQVVDFDRGEFGAVRAEVEQDRFRHFLAVDARASEERG